MSRELYLSLVSDTAAPEQPVYARTSALALWSLLSSLLGFICFWGIGGFIGVALGVMARADIESSQGKRTGVGLALAGISLGALNVILAVLALGALTAHLGSAWAQPTPLPVARSAPAVAPATGRRAPARTPQSALENKRKRVDEAASPDAGRVVEKSIGHIIVADVGPRVRSLDDELTKQRALARKRGQILLLWLVVDDCTPCRGVADALPDPRLQKALANVRLLRVNVSDFQTELRFLRVPVRKIPGFALMGDDNRPVDYVHGGEWDDDVAANIAPVLGDFVRRAYEKRRDPWRGSLREDETTL